MIRDNYGLTREDREREEQARKVIEFKKNLGALRRSPWSRFKNILNRILFPFGRW